MTTETPSSEPKVFSSPLESTKSQAMRAAEELRSAASAQAQQFRTVAEDRAQKLRDAAGDQTDVFKSAAEAQADQIRDAATIQWEEARERAKDIQNELETYVRKNPTKSILTTFGVGLVIGMLLRR